MRHQWLHNRPPMLVPRHAGRGPLKVCLGLSVQGSQRFETWCRQWRNTRRYNTDAVPCNQSRNSTIPSRCPIYRHVHSKMWVVLLIYAVSIWVTNLVWMGRALDNISRWDILTGWSICKVGQSRISSINDSIGVRWSLWQIDKEGVNRCKTTHC